MSFALSTPETPSGAHFFGFFFAHASCGTSTAAWAVAELPEMSRAVARTVYVRPWPLP
jgi:hypothetical protein